MWNKIKEIKPLRNERKGKLVVKHMHNLFHSECIRDNMPRTAYVVAVLEGICGKCKKDL